METLYQNAKTIGRLKTYFQPYLNLLSKPSGRKLFLLLLAMITMQFATSINHLFQWFLSSIDGTSLTAYYYLFTYTEIPLDAFLKITVRLALSLIPNQLYGLPVFLIIDDTLQAKFGTQFQCYQTLFDHAQRNGNRYLKGHCFVALSISVPVLVGQNIKYLNIPIGFRLRQEKENKLQIASKMINTAVEIMKDYPMVILMCDSWYPKGDIIETVKKYPNLELIANVRVDTALFELPPPRTGKRGRPAERGKQLDIHKDFHFIRVSDYFVAVKTVLTNLFGNHILIYLTISTPDIMKHDTYRVFISTVLPERLSQQFKGYEKKLSDSLNAQVLWLLPLYLYSFRWAIEVMFYEHKTFWSFGLYRLRSKVGIENFVNFSSLCYACMKMLPFMDTRFFALSTDSPQACKYFIGEAIRQELFLWRFISNSETDNNSYLLFDGLDSLCPWSKFPFAG